MAIKVILSAQFASREAVLRFRAEAESVARLKHPNIVAIHGTGEHERQPYLVMDYVPGGNLAALVKDQPLPARRAAELAFWLARFTMLTSKKFCIETSNRRMYSSTKLDSRSSRTSGWRAG